MTPPRRRPRRPYPSQKYGPAHKAMRARLAPVVATGTVPCARCQELIGPEDRWELDHRDDGRGWLGPSHSSCNRSAGWQTMVANQNANGNGNGFVEDPPGRWSRRWWDDPAVGTQVLLPGGMVEVHVGRGIWQSWVETTSAPRCVSRGALLWRRVRSDRGEALLGSTDRGR